MAKRRQQGFTLIEVLIAVAILMVAMAAVFSMYSWCTVEVRRARQRTLVTLCAQQVLELIASTSQNVWEYGGFSTGIQPTDESAVKADLLKWQTCIRELPRPATGRIAVRDDAELQYSTVIEVQILYDNYGRDATMLVSQKIPARNP